MTEINTHKRGYVYKTLKNLLVNEWGVTKENILDMVKDYTEKAVFNYLENHYFTQNHINLKLLNAVTEIAINGKLKQPFFDRVTFEQMVQQALEKVIADRVTISVKRDAKAITVEVKEKQDTQKGNP